MEGSRLISDPVDLTTRPTPAARLAAPMRLARPESGHVHRHIVQLYQDEESYARIVARFLAEGLSARRPALVIATAAHRSSIVAALSQFAVAPEPEVHTGMLTLLDAREVLDSLSIEGSVDRDRLFDVLGAALQSAVESAVVQGGRGPVFVHGEMVDLLCAAGRFSEANRLEALWNELAERHEFHLLCTYAADTFGGADRSAAYDEMCAQHSHVVPSPALEGVDEGARLREIARLEQRARALESELDRRARLEAELRAALAARERAEMAVVDRERDLVDCLENAVEAIHWVAADGTVVWANRAELELLGYSAAEYVGRPIAQFHADPEVIDDILCRLGAGETLREYEARLRHKDGSLRTVLINSNVLWRDGKFVHTRCFTRDVTEARRAAAERETLLELERRARSDAEAANRAKGAFLAVMSHELRTPLNAIGGYTELLELGVRGPVTQAQREDLARIRNSQLHLLRLINQVLDYARVESGAAVYTTSDVDVHEVVASVEPLVRPQLAAKGLTLSFASSATDGSVRARADREKVEQILLNLLSNAVKFTEPGGRITVAWALAESAETSNGCAPCVTVTVRDTGIGIPAEKLEAVFEPFVQVESGHTRPHEGTGLGLAISRDLARGMGGAVLAESVSGEGSAFTLVLPRA